MEYELKWAVVVLVWVMLWLAYALISRIHRQRDHLRHREIAHTERMKALEKGVPLPEIPDLGPGQEMPAQASWLSSLWRDSLASGLFLAFTGAGISLGFYLAGEDNIRELWSLGLIPLMAGIGLLLHHRLQRKGSTLR